MCLDEPYRTRLIKCVMAFFCGVSKLPPLPKFSVIPGIWFYFQFPFNRRALFSPVLSHFKVFLYHTEEKKSSKKWACHPPIFSYNIQIQKSTHRGHFGGNGFNHEPYPGYRQRETFSKDSRAANRELGSRIEGKACKTRLKTDKRTAT